MAQRPRALITGITGQDGSYLAEWTLRATSGPTLGAGAYWITATVAQASGVVAPPVTYLVTVGDARLAATALAVGVTETCAVADAGGIYCWGAGSSSQLGADGRPPGPYAAPISAGAQSFTQIVAGRQHTCALTTTGKAFCWGANGQGQLGDGTQAIRSGAVAVEQSGIFVSLVAGGEHTCGLTDEGAALCWGSNAFGQLGDGSLTARPAPNEVAGGTRFTSLTAGVYHTCGLTTDGRALCWGSDELSQIGTETHDEWCPTRCVTIPIPVEGSFVALSAGMQFTCGADQQGTTWCWGGGLSARTKVRAPSRLRPSSTAGRAMPAA
jgi:alpha-tubulin suppressor-like RCC1 family protein